MMAETRERARRAELRRPIDIEKLLDWSYRRELTKAQILGWSYNPLSQVWDYGTPIDGSKVGSGTYYASVFEVENPHEDALLVHETVCELDKLSQNWHDQDVAAMLLADMPEEIQKAAVNVVADYKVQRTAMVTSFAKIGARPRWDVDVPELGPVTGANGRPLWVIDREVESVGTFGAVHTRWIEEPYHHSKKKATPSNARMKMQWEPSLRSIVSRRADYCHWHASLTWLAEELRAKLISWLPTGPSCAALPWVDGETAGPRVLPALDLKAA